MATATPAFDSMIGICETVFWEPITYEGNSINAKIDKDSVVENQTGILQADAVLVLAASDFPSSPPDTGDSVLIGAESYRVGSLLANDAISHTVTVNKIG